MSIALVQAEFTLLLLMSAGHTYMVMDADRTPDIRIRLIRGVLSAIKIVAVPLIVPVLGTYLNGHPL